MYWSSGFNVPLWFITERDVNITVDVDKIDILRVRHNFSRTFVTIAEPYNAVRNYLRRHQNGNYTHLDLSPYCVKILFVYYDKSESPLWLDNHWSYMTKKHCLFFRDFKETMVTANPWYQKHKNVTPVHQWNISMVQLEIGTYLRDIVQWFSGQAPSTTSSCSNGWGEVIVKIYIALDLSLPQERRWAPRNPRPPRLVNLNMINHHQKLQYEN